jgi:hypothetical protein
MPVFVLVLQVYAATVSAGNVCPYLWQLLARQATATRELTKPKTAMVPATAIANAIRTVTLRIGASEGCWFRVWLSQDGLSVRRRSVTNCGAFAAIDHAVYVEFPQVAHKIVDQSVCGQKIAAAFLDAPRPNDQKAASARLQIPQVLRPLRPSACTP